MRRGKWLAWTIPPTGILKMNTNTAGGGVIREDKEVIHAELQVVFGWPHLFAVYGDHECNHRNRNRLGCCFAHDSSLLS